MAEEQRRREGLVVSQQLQVANAVESPAMLTPVADVSPEGMHAHGSVDISTTSSSSYKSSRSSVDLGLLHDQLLSAKPGSVALVGPKQQQPLTQGQLHDGSSSASCATDAVADADDGKAPSSTLSKDAAASPCTSASGAAVAVEAASAAANPSQVQPTAAPAAAAVGLKAPRRPSALYSSPMHHTSVSVKV
jgi:hypothetical protein